MTVAVGNRATMVRRTVTAISVEDVEKRREPSKHYVSTVVSFVLKGLGFLLKKHFIISSVFVNLLIDSAPLLFQVYLIYVTWSDGSINLIFRRYNSFFELQVNK